MMVSDFSIEIEKINGFYIPNTSSTGMVTEIASVHMGKNAHETCIVATKNEFFILIMDYGKAEILNAY